MIFVAVGPHCFRSCDLVWNSDKQDHTFTSVKAARQAIKDELEEPYAEDGTRQLTFGESEGFTEKDYQVYRLIKIPTTQGKKDKL